MSRKTELIDEIEKEKKYIHELTEQLQEHYRVLGGHFVSARMLVSPEQWSEWLSANCDINHESAEFIMTSEPTPPDINRIFLQNKESNLLGFKNNKEVVSGDGKIKPKRRTSSRQ